MANNPVAANRVATMIATFKWVAIALIGFVGFVFFMASIFTGESEGIIVGFFGLVGAALYAVIIFVLFGWFEQTLRMLADIATNTGSGTFSPSFPTQAPPPTYGG